MARTRTTTTTALALAAALALGATGCGSGLDDDQPAHASAVAFADTCPGAVTRTLASILQRVYDEGVLSERTGSARSIVRHSIPLREAIEAGDAAAVRSAAREVLATGHVTDLAVSVHGRTLVSLGPPALAPLRGTLTGRNGTQIGTYVASVWSDSGFVAEADGITEGAVALRTGSASLAGTPQLPATLAGEGTLTRSGTDYAYASLPARAYPHGAVTVYLLKTLAGSEQLCGASSEDTTVNTLTRVAHLIYLGEAGSRTRVQVRRMQHDAALLQAVAQQSPVATEAAIKAVLNQHVVRMRVTGPSGRLLSDVGGPYVLAPVSAPLRAHGRTIGHVELSIQDDEGYLRLARRLAGLDVLMYMGAAHSELVKNSLGPNPGQVPASGRYTYKGKEYRVFTIAAKAFPSGPLAIRVLVPLPYI